MRVTSSGGPAAEADRRKPLPSRGSPRVPSGRSDSVSPERVACSGEDRLAVFAGRPGRDRGADGRPGQELRMHVVEDVGRQLPLAGGNEDPQPPSARPVPGPQAAAPWARERRTGGAPGPRGNARPRGCRAALQSEDILGGPAWNRWDRRASSSLCRLGLHRMLWHSGLPLRGFRAVRQPPVFQSRLLPEPSASCRACGGSARSTSNPSARPICAPAR